jgi:hypothetical protein
MRYYTGLDLGQTNDPTAVAVLEKSKVIDPKGKELSHYDVRHLERFKLGTSYPDICTRVCTMFDSPLLNGTVLGVDQTGVGRPVVDALSATTIKAQIRPVTIVFGHAVTPDGRGGLHVPKKVLVSTLQMLLQSRRIKVAATLPEAVTLVKELENFKVKITLSANEIFGAWREGQHDDLVLAVAIAAFWRESGSAPRFEVLDLDEAARAEAEGQAAAAGADGMTDEARARLPEAPLWPDGPTPTQYQAELERLMREPPRFYADDFADGWRGWR